MDTDGSMSTGLVEPERKRKKTDGLQKPKRLEEDEEYHPSLEKGNTSAIYQWWERIR